MPPAEPICSEPTSGVSIRIRINRGTKFGMLIPYKNRPYKRGNDEVMTKNVATPLNNAKKAMPRPLKRAGIIRGIIKTVGIPTRNGKEEYNPAFAGEIPEFSKILGSQLAKP